jgi:lysophospholipase L1-like esterase
MDTSDSAQGSPERSSPSEPLVKALESIKPYAKYKERSYQTSKLQHIPILANNPDSPIIVLLGDSMIERMTTTGKSPSFHPWPPAIMLPETASSSVRDSYEHGAISKLSNVFNAGVGGDKYQNIIYRLVGDSSTQHGMEGLLEILHGRPVKLWVVQAGTNNLHSKRGLRDAELEMFQKLLEALFISSQEDTRLLLTGLFYRKGICDSLVDKANWSYEQIVSGLNKRWPGRAAFLVAPRGMRKEDHLVDHVHLNEEGYRLWVAELFPKVRDMLE